MAKLEIPVRVYMGELEEIINELKHLQTYKLFEGDDMVLVDCDKVVEIFADHLRAEIRSDSTVEPDLSSYSDKLWRNAYERGRAEAEAEIIYCKDCVHHIDGFFCRQANHHTLNYDCCASVFGAERRTDECTD